jgi:hypothetical protein
LTAGGNDLKLTDNIVAIKNAAQAGGIVVGGKSIDNKTVRKIPLAVHRQSLTGTAEVAAKSWLLAVLVGDTGGTKRANLESCVH